MKTVHCDIHNADIIIFDKEETELFIDDNESNVAILTNKDNIKYVKRYLINKCTEDCPTVIKILSG